MITASLLIAEIDGSYSNLYKYLTQKLSRVTVRQTLMKAYQAHHVSYLLGWGTGA